jgi:hypothetical protein
MSDVPRVCAYCEIGTDLTKEHIFPECLHKRTASGDTTSIHFDSTRRQSRQ